MKITSFWINRVYSVGIPFELLGWLIRSYTSRSRFTICFRCPALEEKGEGVMGLEERR